MGGRLCSTRSLRIQPLRAPHRVAGIWMSGLRGLPGWEGEGGSRGSPCLCLGVTCFAHIPSAKTSHMAPPRCQGTGQRGSRGRPACTCCLLTSPCSCSCSGLGCSPPLSRPQPPYPQSQGHVPITASLGGANPAGSRLLRCFAFLAPPPLPAALRAWQALLYMFCSRSRPGPRHPLSVDGTRPTAPKASSC